MKKLHVLSLLALGAAAVGGLVGCSGSKAADVTVGLICLHGDYSTYDKNFIDAMKAAQKNLGFKLVIKENVPEGTECYDTASALVEQGCNIIFADSFGHEAHMIKAAKENKNVLFCHATGTNGANENLANFGDAFASIYEGRYLAGVAGGLKLAEKYGNGDGSKVSAADAKIGYVGAYTYAEVMSGYTSFFLGVQSIVPAATMQVKFSGSWYDETKEKAIANELIAGGAKLISQHADSHGAPSACEAAKVFNVSYNGSTLEDGPSTYLISSKINWQPYYEHVILNFKKAKDEGKAPTVENDYTGNFANGSVELEAPSANCAEGTQAKLAEVKQKLINGSLHVFDTSKFTVGGQAPTEENCRPGDATWAGLGQDVKFLTGGYYHESEFRSAPSFDVEIDGITLLNRVY